MDYEEHVTIDDMPNEEMREIFENFGRDVAIGQMDLFGGCNVYFPRNWQRPVKLRLAVADLKTLPPKAVAKKHKLTMEQVYKLQRDGLPKNEQLSLLEE